jgi:hypothetical protein
MIVSGWDCSRWSSPIELLGGFVRWLNIWIGAQTVRLINSVGMYFLEPY